MHLSFLQVLEDLISSEVTNDFWTISPSEFRQLLARTPNFAYVASRASPWGAGLVLSQKIQDLMTQPLKPRRKALKDIIYFQSLAGTAGRNRLQGHQSNDNFALEWPDNDISDAAPME